jgi:hypothetical protein
VEPPPRELIESELDAMYNIVKHLISRKTVKSFGFTEVSVEDGDSYSISDIEYNGNTYFVVLVEESNEESGIFIRSGLVFDLEIILPLPHMIRMSNKPSEVSDDLC